MRELVLAYYAALRSALKAKPHLRPCLRRCAECRIFFLTDPRNRRREDLRCPFGCRDCHRRQAASERSRDYYRTPAGKLKKKALNGKRKRPSPKDPGGTEAAAGEATKAKVDPIEIAPPLVGYLCVVVSLIEGRKVTPDEVRQLLRHAVSQHRLARQRWIDYVLRTLKGKPP